MPSLTRHPPDHRWPLCWLAVVATLGALLAFSGWNGTLAIWGIGMTEPTFPDSRSITSACVTHAGGGDPLIANPRDPFDRPFNYPRLWLLLSKIGVNESHTDIIGSVLAGCFIIGMWFFPPQDLSWTGTALLMAAVLSPASFLAMERGNNDLLVFLLVSMAIAGCSSTRRPFQHMAVASVLTAFALKIYPVFALAICLGETKRRFIHLLPWCAAAVIIYVFMIRGDLLLIHDATPKSSGLSYGMNVMWMKAAEHGHGAGMITRALSLIAAGMAAPMLWLGHRMGSAALIHAAPHPKAMAAFRAGAAIYCGTFLLGNNWDYRLIFLLFTLPLLSSLICNGRTWTRILAIVLVAAILVSMWFIRIHQALRDLPLGSEASVLLDEFANWLVYLGLGFIFGSTLPRWFTSPSVNS